jgi:hypothetical protein
MKENWKKINLKGLFIGELEVWRKTSKTSGTLIKVRCRRMKTS